MREYLPGEILMLVGHAKNKANDWLDRQTRMFDENAEDLRRLIVTLSDKDQFDPATWREGYDETQKGATELWRAWQCHQKIDGPERLEQLANALRGYEDYARDVFSDFEKKLKITPQSVKDFDKEFKLFRRKFAFEKVIFLDIDGVLLSVRYWKSQHNKALYPQRVEDRIKDLQLDPGSIGLIVDLCDLADARLVLSSTWRKVWPHSRKELIERLIDQGLRRDIWHPDWMLPVLQNCNKWQEMAHWTRGATDVTALIIDDEVPADPPPLDVKDAVILEVDKYEGFGSRNYFDALDYFGVEDKSVKPPPSLPPQRGMQPFANTGQGKPSRRSATSIRP